MRKYIVFIVAALMATACDLEKEIDINLSYDEAIFIGGHISRQYGATVHVVRTLPPYRDNDEKDVYIADAKVYLTSGGEKIAEMQPVSDYKPVLFHIEIDTFSYNSYGILVESESLGTAYSAEQTLPVEAAPDSITFAKGRDIFVRTKFYFTNDDAQSGYYCSAYVIDESYRILEAKGDLTNRISAIHFYGSTEVKYQEKRWEKDCHIETDLNPKTYRPPYTIEYRADFITLSPDMARYLKSAEEYNLSKDDEFFDSPYIPYSNITGGYGIFGAYTVHQTKGELLAKDFFDDYEPLKDTAWTHEDSVAWERFRDSMRIVIEREDSIRAAIEDSIRQAHYLDSLQSLIQPTDSTHLPIGDGKIDE